jgi:hypothetical protein
VKRRSEHQESPAGGRGWWLGRSAVFSGVADGPRCSLAHERETRLNGTTLHRGARTRRIRDAAGAAVQAAFKERANGRGAWRPRGAAPVLASRSRLRATRRARHPADARRHVRRHVAHGTSRA